MLYRFLSLLILSVLLLHPSFAAAEPIRFAPLPIHGQQYLRHKYYPFIKYLEQGLSQPVEIVYREKYKDIIAGLKADEIDLAILGPLPFVLALKSDPTLRVLLQFLEPDGSTGYTCSVGTFVADQLHISDLKNKHIALTQSYSTCGYLMTEKILNREGLSLADNQFEYIGTHPGCALRVIAGQAAACGIKTVIGKKFYHLGLDLIAESEVVPGFVLVANQRTLNSATMTAIKTHLLELKPLENQADAELTKNWAELTRNGVAPAHIDDFKGIIDMLNRIDIPGVPK